MSFSLPSGETCPYALKPGRFSSHGRILQFLKGLTRDLRILDVGTATGYLGAEIRKLGCQRVSGIESNPKWARQARPFYEEMAVLDVARDPLPWPEGTFQVILLADILEHLGDPASSLKRLIPLVFPKGWVVISLPNVAHWSVRMSLLFGRFPYSSSGILDKAHLRFFTRKSAHELVEQGGLKVEREEQIPLPFARWSRNSGAGGILAFLEFADGCLARLRPSVFSYQFLFFTRRKI